MKSLHLPRRSFPVLSSISPVIPFKFPPFCKIPASQVAPPAAPPRHETPLAPALLTGPGGRRALVLHRLPHDFRSRGFGSSLFGSAYLTRGTKEAERASKRLPRAGTAGVGAIARRNDVYLLGGEGEAPRNPIRSIGESGLADASRKSSFREERIPSVPPPLRGDHSPGAADAESRNPGRFSTAPRDCLLRTGLRETMAKSWHGRGTGAGGVL